MQRTLAPSNGTIEATPFFDEKIAVLVFSAIVTLTGGKNSDTGHKPERAHGTGTY